MNKQSSLKSILIFMAFLFECASLGTGIQINGNASLLVTFLLIGVLTSLLLCRKQKIFKKKGKCMLHTATHINYSYVVGVGGGT